MVFSLRNTRWSVVVLPLLLGGCSFHGTYPDATEQDAAKLRYISNTQNSTLDIYNAQHCEGQTTGLLNNLFVADTRRRVGMSVAPPDNARGYLEVTLKPGQEAFLRLNTNGGSYVCGSAFNFTPKAGEEYELTLDTAPGHCSTRLQQLWRVNGKDVRRPVALFETGLPACNGKTPMFPKPLADTPQRVALINEIVDARGESIMAAQASGDSGLLLTPEKLDSMITARKALLGAVQLPDEYWAQYRQNLQAFDQETRQNKARTLGFYKDIYRMRLQGTEDDVLKQWLSPSDDVMKNRVAANDKMMAQYFDNTRKSVVLDTVNHQLQRMSQLDQRFGVCARFENCWQ